LCTISKYERFSMTTTTMWLGTRDRGLDATLLVLRCATTGCDVQAASAPRPTSKARTRDTQPISPSTPWSRRAF
jgi:hypothetical protein